MSFEPKVLRLFVAISVPDEVKSALREAQLELEKILPQRSASWPKPESMHLTLRFLGNVEASRVAELCEKLLSSVSGFGELDLICERPGCFPDLRFPRVIWAWVHDMEDKLPLLHRRVDEALVGFAQERAEAKFVGHVTLARPRQIKRGGAERLAKFVEGAVERRFGRWRCGEVKLIHSHLSAKGSWYEELTPARLI